MRRLTGDAYQVLPTLPRVYDLVVLSPPAYPSPNQEHPALGTESTLDGYIKNLELLTFLLRRVVKRGAIFCLIQQPRLDGTMEKMARVLSRQWYRMLSTYHWSHGDGTASWVSFLAMSERARLNHAHPAYDTREWAIPWDTVDPTYGFYEFPAALIEAVVGLALPRGGRILDPMCGKAHALSRLPAKYEVTGIDVMAEENSTLSPPPPTP